MPASKDVGENLKELKKSKTKRPKKQMLAIALSEARREGNTDIKPPPKKRKKTGAGQDKPYYAAQGRKS